MDKYIVIMYDSPLDIPTGIFVLDDIGDALKRYRSVKESGSSAILTQVLPVSLEVCDVNGKLVSIPE